MNTTEFDTLTPPQEFTWKWVDLFWILLGTGVIFILGLFIYMAFLGRKGFNPQELLQPTMELSLVSAALEAVALIGGVYLLGIRRRKQSWKAVGLRPAKRHWLLIATIITLIAVPFISIITILLFLVLKMPMVNPQLEFLLPEGFTQLGAWGMLILAGILAPFGEELLFRGVFYPLLRDKWGVWPAVLLSSLIFGIIHGDITVGLTAFLLGIILALIYEYSRSLWTSILVHAINNSAKIALLYLLIKLGASGELGL
jgi:membrane protease YdiL (CAAX protease family)